MISWTFSLKIAKGQLAVRVGQLNWRGLEAGRTMPRSSPLGLNFPAPIQKGGFLPPAITKRWILAPY